jgi:hypothetical protein
LFVSLATAFNCGSQPLEVLLSPVGEKQPANHICMEIKVRGFLQISSFQMGICWDPAQLSYIKADEGALPGITTGEADINMGVLRMSWYTLTGTSESLPDSALVLRLHFVQRPCAYSAQVSVCDLENFPVEFSRFPNDSVTLRSSPVFIPPPVYHVQHHLCSSDFLMFKGQKIHETGFYTDTLPVSGGCDSIVELFVTVHPVQITTIEDTLPLSGSYYFGAYVITKPGRYENRLRTLAGCDSLVILLLSAHTSAFFIPNAFQAGAAGKNGQFGIHGSSDLSIVSLRIFDRWGSLVFQAEDLPADGSGWDGGNLPTGIYLWHCQMTWLHQPPFSNTGEVLLLR